MASSDSASSSSTRRHSSTSSSILSITSAIPSSTSDITPLPSTTTGIGGNGNNNGGNPGFNNNDGPSLASSASLYRTSQLPPSPVIRTQDPPTLTPRPFNEIAVYTFLATLVLLLSVSAAIVVRSFLLRRRHRRLIEEAIRNGTWIPPAPTGRSGPRVDLSKKPRLWEAYLDLHHPQQQPMMMSMSSLDDKDWDSIKPLMAGYVNDSVKTKGQQNPTTGNGGVGGNAVGGSAGSGGTDGNDERNGSSGSRRLLGRFARSVRNILSTTPSAPTLPLAHPISRGTGNNTRQGSAVNLGSNAGSNQDVQLTELGPQEPPKVRVAVLIAMPRPHPSSSSSSTSSPRSASSSSASTSSPRIPTTNSNQAPTDEEEELPHIEMGVAELVVSDSHQLLPHLDGDDGHRDGKGKVRESMASVGSI